MTEQFSRTALLLGEQVIEALQKKRVAIFGIGGVGGYVCEALVRSGIGHFDLIDKDTVSESNINRQIIATHKTVGRDKVEVMKERMLEINPEVDVTVHKCFFLPENADSFPFATYDYVVDAVDTVTAKIAIIMRCKELDIPIISCMGAGNKLDPSQFRVADIYKTTMCPLAKVMRREMKKRGVRKLKVVYSEEKPIEPNVRRREQGSDIPGSIAFTPAAAGLVLASEVVRDLTKEGNKH
ncbi:tRNA A37 threonylcarbamoyladenosine dehydratase [Lachnospiraceae bacterium XBB1006]|nr:tRNA A37 threonylcarbamoyladenosine dehydratase [Lachnospiraceae bacterium XBB1006]